MNIGKAAKHAGMTVKTARYYANIGLVTPGREDGSGYRRYSEEDVANLQFIGRARRYGFSIDECRNLLSLYQDKDRSSKEVKSLAVEKINEIDSKIRDLKSMRDQLQHLARTCHGDDRPTCPIIDALADTARS